MFGAGAGAAAVRGVAAAAGKDAAAEAGLATGLRVEGLSDFFMVTRSLSGLSGTNTV